MTSYVRCFMNTETTALPVAIRMLVDIGAETDEEGRRMEWRLVQRDGGRTLFVSTARVTAMNSNSAGSS